MSKPHANANLDYKQLSRTLEEGTKAPTRSAIIASNIGKIATPVVENAPAIQSAVQALSNVSILQNAVQVLDKISDLGKDMPFVAPAFVLLKFIIEVEKKAQEADAKCNDLLERITFMLSHLPVLKTVTVIEPTRLVIERMNGVLKNAAALVAAYRKQGAVVRRLSIHNRDKFATSVEAINGCSKDLMMSLQIHQTTRLEILTRGIPTDLEDEAAQNFIASHGNLDAVKNNPELVSQFAEQQHLKMDDEVMEQLNTNITDTMQQTMGRLEGMLKGNVSAAIVDGLKALAAEMNAAEAQQHFKCVQCGEDYTATSNGPQSCSFHRAEAPCCGADGPCQYRSHRATHHCEYPYGLFFRYSRGILWYMDTTDKWVSVEDTNLESLTVQKASAGQLLRWASRAALIEEPTILITVGTVWHDTPYYFSTFTADDLESVAESIRLTGKSVIYRTSSDASEFAMAEWVVSATNKVSGIRLSTKAATSDSPFIRVCLIDAATCTKSGDVLALSDGGLHSYKPATPYVLPDTVRISPAVSDVRLRRPRTDFKTRTTPGLRVILKTMSDPPLEANVTLASREMDYFQGDVSVFNNHPVASSTSVTIASIAASFRLVGDQEYTQVKDFKIVDSSQLPVTIDPRQSWRLKFEVTVPRTQDDAQLQIAWWNRALVARDRPLRIKLVLQDFDGEECSIVLEYVFNPFSFEKANDDDLAFFYFDDLARVERRHIRVKKPDSDGSDKCVLDVNDIKIEDKQLEKVVYQALKSGETEVELDIPYWANEEGIWEWKAWALIDLSCRRVYAFKILIKEGRLVSTKRFGCLGYVLCPSYGDVIDTSRPIRYAVEKVKLPEFEPYIVQELPTDDQLDDFVPEPPRPQITTAAAATSTSTSSQPVVSEDLHVTLSRIATALEKLVDIQSRRL